jgi:hypothetical protein
MLLKLRWARFFTLARWDWKLSTRPEFDFEVTFPCGHSECSGTHSVLVRVVELSYNALEKAHGAEFSPDETWTSPHPALFGNGPVNTFWVMPHGAGGGAERATEWADNPNRIWEQTAHN